MGLKIIGAGYPRTGTLSLKHALEQLGFGKCHHGFNVLHHPEQIDAFYDAHNGAVVDWNQIYTDEYQAGADCPTMLFYKELMEAFPDAKVILTVRNVSEWYDSVRKTMWDWKHRANVETRNSFGDARYDAMNELIWSRLFNDRFTEKQHTISKHKQHVKTVKVEVPPERLLVFDVADGWEPLCKFLEVEVPNVPFPHKNSRKAMLTKMDAIDKHGISNVPCEIRDA